MSILTSQLIESDEILDQMGVQVPQVLIPVSLGLDYITDILQDHLEHVLKVIRGIRQARIVIIPAPHTHEYDFVLYKLDHVPPPPSIYHLSVRAGQY